jgi:hypothetical protein
MSKVAPWPTRGELALSGIVRSNKDWLNSYGIDSFRLRSTNMIVCSYLHLHITANFEEGERSMQGGCPGCFSRRGQAQRKVLGPV